MTSLDSVLQQTKSLTRRQRYILAYRVTYWFLRLGSTPWINLPIQANVLFHQDANASSFDGVNTNDVYIGHQITKFTPIAAMDALRNLGICLLELCFGFKLEKYKNHKGLSAYDAILVSSMDHAAAVLWCDDVYEEAGSEFAEAVKWCLQWRSQDDESWREDIWAHVVVPLHNCSKYVS
jgi:hypothetical protein